MKIVKYILRGIIIGIIIGIFLYPLAWGLITLQIPFLITSSIMSLLYSASLVLIGAFLVAIFLAWIFTD